jgi:hypothetical protein
VLLKPVFTILPSVFVLFSCLQAIEVNGQSGLTNFLTYTNTDYGFTIMYPSEWRVDQSTPQEGIAFVSPDNTGLVLVTKKQSNASFDEIKKEAQVEPLNLTSIGYDDRILEINVDNYYLSGHPAIRVLFMHFTAGNETYRELKSMSFTSIIGHYEYLVGYTAFPNRFPDNLSVAQMTVDSFQVINKE